MADAINKKLDLMGKSIGVEKVELLGQYSVAACRKDALIFCLENQVDVDLHFNDKIYKLDYWALVGDLEGGEEIHKTIEVVDA